MYDSKLDFKPDRLSKEQLILTNCEIRTWTAY